MELHLIIAAQSKLTKFLKLRKFSPFSVHDQGRSATRLCQPANSKTLYNDRENHDYVS